MLHLEANYKTLRAEFNSLINIFSIPEKQILKPNRKT